MTNDEESAIARIRRRDPAGLDVLVSLYQVEAARVSYFITHDMALREDLVQDAFIRAYERIAQLRDTQSFRSWFLRSVINASIRAATRTSRQISLSPPGSDQAPAYAGALPSPLPLPDQVAE